MSFCEAVGQDLSEVAWKPGLKALRAQDRSKIAPEDPRRLKGSVDLDAETLTQYPQSNRWDFGIAYDHTRGVGEVLYWVEIHTGSTGEVATVLKKLAWLRNWLKCSALGGLRCEYVWVFSGANHVLKKSPQAKKLTEARLPYCVRLEIHNRYRQLK